MTASSRKLNFKKIVANKTFLLKRIGEQKGKPSSPLEDSPSPPLSSIPKGERTGMKEEEEKMGNMATISSSSMGMVATIYTKMASVSSSMEA